MAARIAAISPFAPGDRVKWNHHSGEVVEIAGDAACVVERGKKFLVNIRDLVRC